MDNPDLRRAMEDSGVDTDSLRVKLYEDG
jgi:hypothetical protein